MRKEENNQPFTETIFFYGDEQEFTNRDLGIYGHFSSKLGRLMVKMSFNKGEYLLFLENPSTRTVIVLKQSQDTDELPFQSNKWIKKQINSEKDIPEKCRYYCSYDETNQTLIVDLIISDDHALDYGTRPWCYATFLQFMPGGRWRFLDRINGG